MYSPTLDADDDVQGDVYLVHDITLSSISKIDKIFLLGEFIARV